MKSQLSFRALVIILFVGTLIPLLLIVGLLVFRLQQTYLLNDAETRLVNVVREGVEQYAGGNNLTTLAVNLGEDLRVLGADMFIQNAVGAPVPPSLGTGPWLDSAAHQDIRASRTSSIQMIGSGPTARLVYLAVIIDPAGTVLGSVETSLPMTGINDQLNALRKWVILIISIASSLGVILAFILSGLITRPIQNLVGAVERVRQGNLAIRAPVSAVNELGQLAVTYNQMLDTISDELDNQTLMAENMRRFAADASHELRSPLTIFRNSVELLDKAVDQNDKAQIEEIRVILSNEVDTMTVLVENLLLLARLDQPKEEAAALLHPEEIQPLPLLEEIYERSQLLTKGQILRLQWPADEISPIWADRDMLRRALNNIIENAIKHTPAGKQIILGLENRGDFCTFIVEDQGEGIPPDQLSKVYERFYRTDESRNRRIPGTGLGLSIVAAIVEIHGGRIDVQSEPGKGTRFSLSIKYMDPGA